MKLVSLQVRTPVGILQRAGALHGQTIVDLNMAYALMLAGQKESQPYRLANAIVPPAMLEFLEGGPSAMAAARQAFAYAIRQVENWKGPDGQMAVYPSHPTLPEGVRIIAPLPNPPSLRDFIAFEDHIAATSKKRGQPIPPEWYKAPAYYKGNHRTIIG
ncbi:MAG: fumarylacetoacetate hydrolase family protein, partial [Nitrospiraceae bacterium]